MAQTRIFTIDIEEISCNDYAAAYFLMSEDRKKRCDAYKRETDKMLCIAADMLLRRVIGEMTGIDKKDIVFDVRPDGKPFCRNIGSYFSVSHSGNLVAAAFNEKYEVGIDVELIRPVKISVAKHIFTREDFSFISDGADVFSGLIEDPLMLERFFRCWTYKEAVVKMTGEGITENIRAFSYEENKCNCTVSDGYCITAVCQRDFL